MKVFLPFKKDLNPYLDEIEIYSDNSFIYDHFKNYSLEYKIVNIHWPEAIFDWWEPTEEQLKDLENEIELWKKNSLLVYTKHDYTRNKGTTPMFEHLFKIIEKNAEVFIHLGSYSKEKYQKKYPRAIHKIVPHPLYEKCFEIIPKEAARAELGIAKDAFVLTASGAIRNFKERKLVFQAFKAIEKKNKVLISTRMRTELQRDFKGRLLLKKFFDIKKYFIQRFKNKFKAPRYLFSYKRLSSKELSLRVAAADIILIPRINILNSGNVFLAFTFNKIVVGPGIGNIKENLENNRMPVFDPFSKKSVKIAIDKGVAMSKDGYNYDKSTLENLKPEKVAGLTDSIFLEFFKQLKK